jgi:hypothetical protein
MEIARNLKSLKKKTLSLLVIELQIDINHKQKVKNPLYQMRVKNKSRDSS